MAKTPKQIRWQAYYDDYCREVFGGRELAGHDHDEAVDYADEKVAEDEAKELEDE